MYPNRVIRHVLKMLLSPQPPVKSLGKDEWFRAAGACLCPVCLQEYCLHPDDEQYPELVVLCNGWRVKL